MSRRRDNLSFTHRAELTPTERASHIARRKEIYEQQHPETAHGSPTVSRQVGDTRDRSETLSFVADTASKTGQAERSIQRDAERGEKVCDEVKGRA